jgi:hypothetical protein
MPVHIEEVTTDVMAYAGEIPLSPAQIEMLVKLVIKRIEERQQETAGQREATGLRSQSAPRLPIDNPRR